MKIGVLTSSRADYGIYQPLLAKLNEDPFFDLQILVFGTHLSKKFGLTVKHIEDDGYNIGCRIDTMPDNDSPEGISKAISKTIGNFATFFNKETYDLIIALGDRYEMFGAVTAAIPFNIPIAHIHGGETTLGAIDNAFRHSITSMSALHFTACSDYQKKVTSIIGTKENVFNVGSLSIDTLSKLKLLSREEFSHLYNIDIKKPSILFTFHPETVSFAKNKKYIETIIEILEEINQYQIIITMPNADTMGDTIRQRLTKHIEKSSNSIGIESFGSLGYLSCMKHCAFMLGNSSSGFIEASFFQKPVINLGNRQKGRHETPNIFTCPIQKEEIRKGIKWAEKYINDEAIKIYGKGNAAQLIIDQIKLFQLNRTKHD